MSQSHDLSLWVQQEHVADITHVPLDDAWTLRYTESWQANEDAFALSPALPLKKPAAGRPGAGYCRRQSGRRQNQCLWADPGPGR